MRASIYLALLCVSVVGFAVQGMPALAAGAAEAEVEEVFIDQRNQPKTDIWVKLLWTGSGDQEANSRATLQVQEATFGDTGISRIQTLFLSALLSNKTVWVRFDDQNRVTGVYIKSRRNPAQQ